MFFAKVKICIYIYIYTYLTSGIFLCMGWQEPFTLDALSQGLVLQSLFPNALICAEESQVISLSPRNSAVLRGKAKVNISRLWVGGNCNELKINEWCLVKKGPLSRGICSLKALRLNSRVLA